MTKYIQRVSGVVKNPSILNFDFMLLPDTENLQSNQLIWTISI